MLNAPFLCFMFFTLIGGQGTAVDVPGYWPADTWFAALRETTETKSPPVQIPNSLTKHSPVDDDVQGTSSNFTGLPDYLDVPGGVGGTLRTIVVYDPTCTREYEVITFQDEEFDAGSSAAPGTRQFKGYSTELSYHRLPFELVRRVHRPAAQREQRAAGAYTIWKK